MIEKTTEAKLSAWIEPQISALDIDETQNFPTIGGDGFVLPDCTRS